MFIVGIITVFLKETLKAYFEDQRTSGEPQFADFLDHWALTNVWTLDLDFLAH